MDKKISRVYCYIAEDILEEYASSYSQVDKERLAKTLQDMVNEKVEKFAERLKAEAHYTVCDTRCVSVSRIDEICKEITEGKV